MRRLLRPLAAVIPLVLAAACGDPAGSTPSIEDTTFAPALEVNLAAMTRTGTGLYYRDLQVGAGAQLAPGQTVGVHYTGWLPNGTMFDRNQPGQAPLSFQFGVGAVIPGFDQGLAGMRVGGRRQIIIPPHLGYGNQAVGPIPANSILVFTVDLVSAQ